MALSLLFHVLSEFKTLFTFFFGFSPLKGRQQAILARKNLSSGAGGGERLEIYLSFIFIQNNGVGCKANKYVFERKTQLELVTQVRFYKVLMNTRVAGTCLVTCRQLYSFFSKALNKVEMCSKNLGKTTISMVPGNKKPVQMLQDNIKTLLKRSPSVKLVQGKNSAKKLHIKKVRSLLYTTIILVSM